MNNWLRRIRGAIGMGLTWAFAWALTGLLIGVASVLFPGPGWATFFRVFDAPLPAMAVPGFFGGALFSVVLGIAARRRRFDQLSLPRFAAWGALGGVLLSLVPATLVAVGLASIGNAEVSLWRLTALIAGPLTLLCTASAAGSLVIARRAEHQALHDAGAEVNRLSTAERNAQLPGERED